MTYLVFLRKHLYPCLGGTPSISSSVSGPVLLLFLCGPSYILISLGLHMHPHVHWVLWGPNCILVSVWPRPTPFFSVGPNYILSLWGPTSSVFCGVPTMSSSLWGPHIYHCICGAPSISSSLWSPTYNIISVGPHRYPHFCVAPSISSAHQTHHINISMLKITQM